MKKSKKGLIIVFSVLIGVIALAFITNYLFPQQEDEIAENTSNEDNKIKSIGDEIVCDNYKVIVESFNYKTGSIDYFQKIPDGQEWIGVIINATNTSSKNNTINSSDFNIINTNGQVITPDAITYNVWGVESFGSPELIPNGTKRGYIVFSNDNTNNDNIVLEIKCNRNKLITSSEKKEYLINLK